MNQSKITNLNRAFTLTELLAVVAILGVIAVMVIPRVTTHSTTGDAAACHAHQGEIELQAQLWRRIHGSFPAANLSDIGIDLNYFPEGLPTCPVNGTTYSIDTTTGRVTGHNH